MSLLEKILAPDAAVACLLNPLQSLFALGQHVLWGSLLLFLIIYGPGKLSLDYLLNRTRWSNP